MPHLLPFELRAMERGLTEGRKEGLTEGRKEGLTEGRKEGLSEGRKEGLKEGRTSAMLEAIHDLASAKFGPATAAQIMAKIGPSTDVAALKSIQIAIATAGNADELRLLLPSALA